MKKYIKNTNLVPIDNKIKIYSSLSDVPNTLTNNEVVIVEGIGVFECNGPTKTKIYNDGRNTSSWNIGEIRMFYGDTIPNGWLECTGQTFDTTQYPSLYSFLGTNKVPDYRETALRGGTPVGTFSNDAMGSHSHTFSGGCHSHAVCATSHSHAYCAVWTIRYCRNYCYSNCCTYWGLAAAENSSGAVHQTTPAVCANTSGITVGTSPWASTVTRAREVGVRYIMYAGE